MAKLARNAGSQLYGQQIHIRRAIVHGSEVFRVVVGHGLQRQDADRMCTRIESFGYNDCFVAVDRSGGSTVPVSTTTRPVATQAPDRPFHSGRLFSDVRTRGAKNQAQLNRLRPSILSGGKVSIRPTYVDNTLYQRVVVGTGTSKSSAYEVCRRLKAARFNDCFVSRQ